MSKLTINGEYWIATENYGVLKAIYKEANGASDSKVGYFQCDLVDGFMILNNGIRYAMERTNEIKPKTPDQHAPKEEWEKLGWWK